MLTEGWIKIDRNLLKWRWYSDTATLTLWIHLLLQANYEDRDFRGIEIRRGELVRSQAQLEAETGLTRQQVRTALTHLKQTGEITTKQHGRIVVISIPNYDYYQSNQPDTNQVSTRNQPDTNHYERKKEGKKGRREDARAKRAAPPRESTYMMAVRMQQEAEAELAAEEEDDNE